MPLENDLHDSNRASGPSFFVLLFSLLVQVFFQSGNTLTVLGVIIEKNHASHQSLVSWGGELPGTQLHS